MCDSSSVLYERRGTVGLITLNRPERMNAMDQDMLVHLGAALDQAQADEATGAVVVTGAHGAGKSQLLMQVRADFEASSRVLHVRCRAHEAVQRGALLAGSGTSGACDGTFTYDLNARWAAKPAQNPGPGVLAQAQLWFRDPLNTAGKKTTLSNALEFAVCP